MLIIIEGIDGSGKNTQTQRLKARLEAEGHSVATLAFPRYGQTHMARAVADYLNGKYGSMDDAPALFPALLFAGDRFESKGLIEEAMATHDVLLIDRYVPSNMAHQAAKVPHEERQALIDWIGHLEYVVYALPRPDVTLYLDVPADTAARLIARKKPRSYTDAAADLHEADHSYLACCREVYQQVGRTRYGGRWVRIPCTDASGDILPQDVIAGRIWDGLFTEAAG